MLAGDHDAAVAAITPHLPHPVDHVLLQADLTAVAPGPLETELARTLHLVADVESRGGATVYRFTPGSVRRAFDAGWSALEVHDFVGSVSRTPVPQPLTYLVDDVVADLRHGAGRAGRVVPARRRREPRSPSCCTTPRPASLGLRRIAPTVLISTIPVDVLLPRLRELGAAPVVEAPDGTVRVARRDLLRARATAPGRSRAAALARDAGQVAAVVTAIRSGDRAVATRPDDADGTTTPSSALAALREAIEAGSTVVIGYVDNHGARSDRVVDPRPPRGRQPHGPRPPGRRRARVRRAPDHVRAPRSRPVRRVVTWTSSGTPRRRRRCSTPTCPTPDALVAHLADRELAARRPSPTGDVPSLQAFQAELRPVFEASDAGDVHARGERPQRPAGDAPGDPDDQRPRPRRTSTCTSPTAPRRSPSC